MEYFIQANLMKILSHYVFTLKFILSIYHMIPFLRSEKAETLISNSFISEELKSQYRLMYHTRRDSYLKSRL